jgi:hypothetical protein
MRLLPRIVVIGLAVALISTRLGAGSLLPGYFPQVTANRDRGGGGNPGPLEFRWLRPSFSVSGATLTLSECRSQVAPQARKTVVVIQADPHGALDFGAVAGDHDSRVINVDRSDRMACWFEVEVTDSIAPGKDTVVSVSPIRPDCSGGHEFIERKKS